MFRHFQITPSSSLTGRLQDRHLSVLRLLLVAPAVGTGAGHHSVIHDPKADFWYAVYHRRPLTETDGNHRVTCIERMEFDAEGLIKPSQLTHHGVASRALSQPTDDPTAKEKTP
jgi:hypothetical protein